MEFSLSNDLLKVFIWLYVLVPGVAFLAFVTYRQRKAKRRAENKVRMADHILLADIKILARMNSRLLDDAITLRCAQMEQGRNPRCLNLFVQENPDFPCVVDIGRFSATVGAPFVPLNRPHPPSSTHRSCAGHDYRPVQ